jgi:type II secretion system protein N
VRVRNAKPLLPLGIKALGIDISCLILPGVPHVELKEVGCRVSPLSFVRKVWDGSVQGEFFEGTLKGTARLAPMDRPEIFDGHIAFDRVGLAEMSVCFQMMDNLSGTISGEIVFDGPMSRIARGTGNATLTMDKVLFTVDRPGTGKITVSDGQGEMKLRLAKGRVEIIDCSFFCRGLQGTVTGNVLLRHPLAKSELRLLLTMTLDEFAKEQFFEGSMTMRSGTIYKISLAGLIDNPRTRLLN